MANQVLIAFYNIYMLLQVIDRETDKISREKIYSILHNAGLARK